MKSLMCEVTPVRPGDALSWEILLGGEAEGVDMFAGSRKRLETELARESDRVGGTEAEGPYDPVRDMKKEGVQRSSLRVVVGAGTHPKTATTIAESEGTMGWVVSSASMEESCSDTHPSEAATEKMERRELSCEGV